MKPDGSEDSEVFRAHLSAPLQVVVGKGGVGRTLVSSGIALRSARQGARTLLLEVNATSGLAEMLDLSPSVDKPAQVVENLWLCRLTPRDSLAEYALMVLRFRALYSLVFDNRLVRYLLRSIPSLAEFTMLGKAWYHATELLPDGSPRYERVVIDAPATGHAITFLSVARTVFDVSPAGAMKVASGRMADLVEAESTRLHIVCLPEEMPVNEGLELVKAARGRLRMTLGLGFVNRNLPQVLGPEDEGVFRELRRLTQDEPQLVPYVETLSRRKSRCDRQREHRARFVAESGLPIVDLEESRNHGVPLVEEIVARLDALAGAEARKTGASATSSPPPASTVPAASSSSVASTVPAASSPSVASAASGASSPSVASGETDGARRASSRPRSDHG